MWLQGASAAASVTVDWQALRHYLLYCARSLAASVYRVRSGFRSSSYSSNSSNSAPDTNGSWDAGGAEGAAAETFPNRSASRDMPFECAVCDLSPPEARSTHA